MKEHLDLGVNNILIHTSPSLISRLNNYVTEDMKLNSKIFYDFILIDNISIKQFLNKLYSDDMKVWRYIDRIYFFRYVSENYDDILQLKLSNGTIRVVAYPKNLQIKLVQDLEKDYVLNPQKFTHYLSVVKIKSKYYYGIYPTELYYNTPLEKNKYVSRAYYKMYEVATLLNLSIKPWWKLLDIGSAPGGWIQYYCDKVSLIVAVDPADLNV